VKGRIALGLLYADRQGLLQNDVLALLWFNFAVSQGSREAASLREDLLRRMTPAQIMEAQRLGREYKTERDYKNMALDLKPRASAGDASAQMKLGTLYYKGQGVSRDYAEAARLFLQSAEKGDPYAQSNLGYMYELGEGIPQDYNQAVKWYVNAAKQGNMQAQLSVGKLYEKGQGVPQSDVFALMYYTLAAAHGEMRATSERDRLTVWMSPNQVAEAQRRAREFKTMGR
jgi:TPR repeat protein